ncbi:MAG: hypothetical protein ACE5GI_09200, partial [Candidatus Aminicenantales bacterium]
FLKGDWVSGSLCELLYLYLQKIGMVSFLTIFSFRLRANPEINPQEIIEKSIEAQGGREVLEGVKKMEIKGHVTDFRKSVHVPDFLACNMLKILIFMNNSG